ncbi:hypothetical protein D3C76_1002140 [compost metagenome]
MRHRAIAIEGGNGRKTQRHEIRAPGTRGSQLLVNGQLGNHLTAEVRLEPGEELAQRRTVLLHDLADMHQIIVTFAGFAQGGGVEPLDQHNLWRQIAQQAAGDTGRVYQQPPPRRNSRQGCASLAVVAHLDAVHRQHLTQMRVHLVLTHEQNGLLLTDQGKGQENRVVRHITATQVEQPGDVIERSDKVPVSPFGLDALAQLR